MVLDASRLDQVLCALPELPATQIAASTELPRVRGEVRVEVPVCRHVLRKRVHKSTY
jgi:hypothetical protein